MKLKEFSLPLVLLLIAGVLAAISMYLNGQKKVRPNESKSQLTAQAVEKKASKLRTFLDKKLIKDQQESASSSTPLLDHERQFTEQEITQMTENGFEELLTEVERRLPKISDIKKIPSGALHRTPETIIEAGRNLGLVKEILISHEKFIPKAIGFYDHCAKSEERPTPVRALCFTNLVLLKKQKDEKINLKDYPPQVIDLAKMITDI